MPIQLDKRLAFSNKLLKMLEVGMEVYCNGDGRISRAEFYSGKISYIGEDFILIIRDDGVVGNGPDGEWIVRPMDKSKVQLCVPSQVQAAKVPATDLEIGNLFSFAEGEEEIQYTFIHYSAATQSVWFAERTGPLPARAQVSVLHGNQEVYRRGNRPFLSCFASSCRQTAVKAITSPYLQLYCKEHYPDDVTTCQECGGTVRFAQVVMSVVTVSPPVTRSICPTCNDRQRQRRLPIQNHSYKPEPIFFTVYPRTDDLRTRIFYGIEAEMECPKHGRDVSYDDDGVRRIIEHETPPALAALLAPIGAVLDRGVGQEEIIASVLKEKFNGTNPWFYLKNDGSLDNGFELVTEPATLDAHKQIFPWADVLTFAREIGMQADSTSTCGLHIHASKKDLNEDHRIRLGYFVNSQRKFMEKVARRAQNDYARFKPANTPMEHMALNTMGGKYEALNWNPRDTVEFRLFKGTVNEKYILSSLETAMACILFTATESIESLQSKPEALKRFILHVLKGGYEYLPDYLKERGVA